MEIQKEIQALVLETQKLEKKQEKIKEITNGMVARIDDLDMQISSLQKTIEYLKTQKKEIKHIMEYQIKELDLEYSRQKIMNKISLIAKQINISNEMIAQLLTKKTGKLWQVSILEHTGDYKTDLIDNDETYLGVFASTSIARDDYKYATERCLSNFADAYSYEAVDMDNKIYALLAHIEGNCDDALKKRKLKSINWFIPYAVKKILGGYIKGEQTCFDEINDTAFGNLIYDTIDEYVSNLINSNNAQNKTTAIKK